MWMGRVRGKEEYVVRDVKREGRGTAAMGCRSIEWNWPKEAMNRPIGAGVVAGAKVF